MVMILYNDCLIKHARLVEVCLLEASVQIDGSTGVLNMRSWNLFYLSWQVARNVSIHSWSNFFLILISDSSFLMTL